MFLLSFSLNGQVINHGEYFFDTDPGLGNGIAIPSFTASDSVDLNFTVNTAGLSEGYHKVYIRLKDDNGEWGIYSGRTIHIISSNPPASAVLNIIAAEYFFDTDPGYGTGIALPFFAVNDSIDLNFTINTTGLSEGYHKLYIRLKNDTGEWGIYSGRTIYILPLNSSTITPISITSGEYFFDSDPGYGNAISFPPFSPSDTTDNLFSAPVSTLPVGLHHVYLRYKDSFGEWGIYSGRQFEVLNCSNPMPNFTAQYSCAGDSITLINSSNNADSLYLWDFDNDNIWDDSTAGNTTFFPSFTDSGTVKLKLINMLGCADSISINITLNPTYDTTYFASVCDSALINGNWYFSSQLIIDTLATNSGCDSIIKTNLTLKFSTDSSINATSCDSYISPSGNVLTSTGIYTDTIPNANGCDSIININLIINTSPLTSISPITCDFYISPSGNVLTSSGIYFDTVSTVNGCDSIITINLTINTGNAGTISNTNGTLIGSIAGANYQWLNCNDLFSEVVGEINQSFTPTIDGSYSCKVTDSNGCTDTTNCIDVSNVGLNEERDIENTFLIYPNPASNVLIIEMEKHKELEIKIFDDLGKLVYAASASDINVLEINIASFASGQYIINLTNDLVEISKKIVIH